MEMKAYASSPRCIRKRRFCFSIFNREKLPSTWQSRHLLIRLFTKRVIAFRFASASWVGSMQAINLLVRSSAISQHLSDPDDDSCLPTIDVFSSFESAIVLSATGTSMLLPASPMPSKKRANESATYVTYGPMRLAGECDYQERTMKNFRKPHIYSKCFRHTTSTASPEKMAYWPNALETWTSIQ